MFTKRDLRLWVKIRVATAIVFFYFSLSSTPLQIVKRWSYTIVDYIFDNHIVGFHYIRVDLLDGTIRITEVWRKNDMQRYLMLLSRTKKKIQRCCCHHFYFSVHQIFDQLVVNKSDFAKRRALFCPKDVRHLFLTLNKKKQDAEILPDLK